MRLSSMLRLFCLAALGACSLAVAVARCAPREAMSRVHRAAQRVGVNGSFFRPAAVRAVVLDTATGLTTPLPAPQGEALQWPAFSEWSNAHGERQVVGLWIASQGASGGSGLSETGLGRFLYPSGRVLDRISDCPIPRRAPCWYPGPQPRVLYAATDGQLYQCAFGGPRSPEVTAVAWPDREDHPRIENVIWPDAPVLRGGVIAVVNGVEPNDAPGPYRLWRLGLSPDGSTVEEAAPLSLDDPEPDATADWRAPSVSQAPGGECLIAWLRYTSQSRVAHLVVAPIRPNAQTDEPTVITSETRTLADGIHGMPPAFSPDGQWVHAVQERPGDVPTLRRFSVSVTTP